MKKFQHAFHLLLALATSFLFYEGELGVNLFIFSLLLLLGANAEKRLPLSINLFVFLSSLLIFIQLSALAAFLWFLGQLLLVSLHLGKVSWFTALLHSPWLFLTSGLRAIPRRENWLFVPRPSISRLALLSIPPLGLGFLFYGLYANSNPNFARLIQLNFLFDKLPPFSFFALFVFAFFAGFAYISPYPLNLLLNWDARQTDTLVRSRKKFSKHPLWLKYEYQSALTSLTVLNLLLLAFHLFDLAVLVEGRPAEGLTYAEWVHQGIGALIVSIVLASSLLLYVFRGNLNFFSQNKWLRLLSGIWIGLNVLLVLTCVLKNSAYIEVYGFTYKRIGVYVYLMLALMGLSTTAYKIWRYNSLYWIVRTNLRLGLWTLLIVASIPWARITTNFNLNRAQVKDYAYLLNLSDANIDLLQANASSFPAALQERLNKRVQKFRQQYEEQSWKNFRLTDSYVYRQTNFITKP